MGRSRHSGRVHGCSAAHRQRVYSNTFYVAGDNDVTLLLKAVPGGCRPQHNGVTADLLPSYTVVFGSHRNSCFKVERDGLTCSRVSPCLPSIIGACSGVSN